MFTFFVIASILMWIFEFATRISFCFKQEYKKYYSKLFEDGGIHRPYNWGISRQKNHDVYVVFKWFTIIFIIITILFGFSVCDIPSLIAIIAIPLLIVLPVGEIIGKDLCRISVKKQCKKFDIPFQTIQDSLPKF